MTREIAFKSYTDYVNLSYAMYEEDNSYPFENVLTFDEYTNLLQKMEDNAEEVFDLIENFVEASGRNFDEEMTKAINVAKREGIFE